MFPAQRRRLIAQQINKQGYVSISSLCDYFQVSKMTIHRDLYALEESGQIKKTRGGAVSQKDLFVPVNYKERALIQEEEKTSIGKKAIEFIHDGETIFLDASTTCIYIAKNLDNYRNLTVYTNGYLIVSSLLEKQGVEVHTTGGLLSKETAAFIGSESEKSISVLRPDKCFIGAAGISLEDGILDPSLPEASMKRAIVGASREVFLVAAAEKFNNLATHISVPLDMIDVIITNKGLSENLLSSINKKEIRCILV